MTQRLLVVGEALVDIVTDASGESPEHIRGRPAHSAAGQQRHDFRQLGAVEARGPGACVMSHPPELNLISPVPGGPDYARPLSRAHR